MNTAVQTLDRGRQARDAEALSNLGVTLAKQGKLEEAIPTLREAVRLKPDYAQAQHNLGVALAHHGRPDEAVACFRQALQCKPDYAEACYNLGNVLAELKQHDEAVAVYRRAIAIKPDYFDAYNNLGLLLCDLGQYGEASILLRQAVRLRPQSPEAHNNLGMVLAEMARYAEAEPCYQEALRLRPGFADAHANFGNAYKEQGRLEEAVASYDIALAYRPDSVSAHWNRALARLQQGNFADGWAEYEWRWQRKQTPMRPFRQPRWDGASLAGRTILLWMEQGLGDMIQFIRYAALLQEQGGRVVVECPGFLIPLFSTCPGIAQLVAEGSPLPDFDVHAPLMSLPHLCRTTLTSIPAKVPYLFANDALVGSWARQLARYDADYRIGITWQGNPHHRHDRYRSIPVQLFAPLGRLPGVRLINLQKGSGIDHLTSIGDRFAVIDLPSEQDPAVAFMDTAAIMRNLHLVITVDTAIAHLAGALGVPVWTAIAAIPDWRWLLDREDSPWYPTMRIFRQQEFGNWREVIDRMAAEMPTQPFTYRDVAEWRAG